LADKGRGLALLPVQLSASEARAQRLRELEDKEDRAAVGQARKQEDSVAWVVIRRELGLG
jgi:hypothetical protein